MVFGKFLNITKRCYCQMPRTGHVIICLYHRSRNIFGNAQEIFISLRFKKQTQAPAFVTIPLRTNIQPRLSSFDFIFICCFVFTVFSVVMITLLYHPSFGVIPLLRGNSDALNQTHLRNFSAYIIKLHVQTYRMVMPEF